MYWTVLGAVDRSSDVGKVWR